MPIRTVLIRGAVLVLIAALGASIYYWRAEPSSLPSEPKRLRVAPAELTLTFGMPGVAISPEGQGWVLHADPKVMPRYETRGGSPDGSLMVFYAPLPGPGRVFLADLRTGQLYLVPGEHDARVSQDLQSVLITDWLPSQPRAVQGLGENARSFLVPAGTTHAFWDGPLLFVTLKDGRAVVDPQAGLYWSLPEGGANHLRRVGDQVCYQHSRGFRNLTAVVCFTPGRTESPLTLLDDSDADPGAGSEWLAPDPTGRHLALVYKRNPRTQSGGAGVAVEAGMAAAARATKPMPGAIDLADTLLMYDAESGRTSRIPFPGRRPTQSVWSPDGLYLGLNFQSKDNPAAAWVVETGTGKVFVSGQDPLPWTPVSWEAPAPPPPTFRWRLNDLQGPGVMHLEPITP